MFILGIILAILSLGAIGYGALLWTKKTTVTRRAEDRFGNRSGDFESIEETPYKVAGRWTALGGALGLLLAIFFIVSSMFYTQEAGEAKVLRDWTGNIVGATLESGAHWKEPWVETIDWDIRNQDVTFTGDGSTTHAGQNVVGAEITFNDKDGVTGSMDIQVIYSIQASAVEDLTFEYTGQADFESKVVQNDIKSLPRDILAQRTTLSVYNERAELRGEITELLREAWSEEGVDVENVNIHGIRYPKDVEQRFIDAQNAQTDLIQAETAAKTAKTKAEGEAQASIAKANGEAEANRILAESLTENILRQRWIDAIANGKTIIVPQDFTSLGNLAQ